jgi:hypothetical protein
MTGKGMIFSLFLFYFVFSFLLFFIFKSPHIFPHLFLLRILSAGGAVWRGWSPAVGPCPHSKTQGKVLILGLSRIF